MAVDYISTAPWNNPYRPWPQYAQIALSAHGSDFYDGQLNVLDLTYFDPDAVNNTSETLAYSYTGYDESRTDSNYFHVDLFVNGIDPGIVTILQVYADGELQYEKSFYIIGDESQCPQSNVLGSFNTPVKMTGEIGCWGEVNGTDVAALYIQPIYTSLTPWEHRRLWNLNG